MTRKAYGVLVMMTMIAGMVGGFLSNHLLVGGVVTAQESGQSAKIVEAEEFRLVTKDGKPRATLLLWNGDLPALTLADSTCHNRVFLGVFNEEQPALLLNDKGCKQRVALDLQPDGLPSLTLRDKNDHPRARMRLLLDGTPVLTLYDEKRPDCLVTTNNFF